MANEVLTRTPTSEGNRKQFTWAGWIKRNAINASGGNGYQGIFAVGTVDGSEDTFMFSADQIRLRCEAGSDITTSQKYRGCGNWMHVMMVVDTTLYDPDHRCIFYVNGVKSDVMSQEDNITQNANLRINSVEKHYLGEFPRINNHLDGQIFDVFLVDGQALTPDVFGFYKDGDGYQSSGTTQATDFRNGQWVPKKPQLIIDEVNESGGFGVNGFYLPMNDSSNPGADFHCAPNSIIKLKGEDLPQPQNGAPTTSDAYVSQLRQETGTLGFDGVVAFDGSALNRLTLPVSSDFAFGTGDLTVEMFVYHTDLTGQQTYFGDTYAATAGLYLYKTSTNQISVYDTHQRAVSEANVIKKGQWHHLAWTVSSGVLRQFVDGNKITETSYNGDYTTTEYFLGDTAGTSSGEFVGFMSNVRVIKGTALYTANFTPPTEPLTNVTNTKLLCCNSSTSATSATVTPGTITKTSNVFATRNELTGSIVLAVPGASTATGGNLIKNGSFDSNVSNWTATDCTTAWENGQLKITRSGGGGLTANQAFTTVSGKRYTIKGTINSSGSRGDLRVYNGSGTGGSMIVSLTGTNGSVTHLTGSFTATSTTSTVIITVDNNNTVVYADNIVVKQEDAPRDYSADIKGSGTNKTLTAGGGAGVGYELGGYYGSAMSFDGSGDYISVSANSDFANLYDVDHTIEFWYKNDAWDGGYLPHHDIIALRHSNGNVAWRISFTDKNNVEDGIQLFGSNGFSSGANTLNNGWNHCAVEQQNGATTLYINGVAAGRNGNEHGYQTYKASTGPIIIGTDARSSNLGDTYSFNGQIQDVRIYKGLAKYKGGFDVPKPYTPVGIESWRTTADTCKNNFATLNAVQINRPTLTDGNLSWSASTAYVYGQGTIGIPTTGKWVFEGRFNNNTANNNYNSIGAGITNPNAVPFSVSGNYGINDAGPTFGQSFIQDGVRQGSITLPAGTIIQVLVDRDNNQMTFVKDGVLQTSTGSTVTIPTDETLYPMIGEWNLSGQINFGQNPSFSGQTTAGTNADDSGKGLFKYAPPTGFLALCEDNLPTPAIADPGEHFKTVLWTGVDDTNKIKCGFQPDFVWIKNRDFGNWHALYDSIRGPYLELNSNTNYANRDRSSNDGLRSFDSDGFTSGLDDNAGGRSGDSYVAWCWKAGGAAVSNTDGTITSQVSANQTAGFSIVSTNGSGTAGHGLNTTPKFIIQKRTASTSDWSIQHHQMMTSSTGKLLFSSNGVVASSTPYMFNANSTTFEPIYTDPCINYCWTEIEGFSKFGSYIGNESADGPFVYCGFKPAWVLVKNTSDASDWRIYDSSRVSTNPNNLVLYPNLSNVDTTTSHPFDFVSNGFKIRGDFNDVNDSGDNYIFAAFAESPFQTANAK